MREHTCNSCWQHLKPNVYFPMIIHQLWRHSCFNGLPANITCLPSYTLSHIFPFKSKELQSHTFHYGQILHHGCCVLKRSPPFLGTWCCSSDIGEKVFAHCLEFLEERWNINVTRHKNKVTATTVDSHSQFSIMHFPPLYGCLQHAFIYSCMWKCISHCAFPEHFLTAEMNLCSTVNTSFTARFCGKNSKYCPFWATNLMSGSY